MGVDVNASPPGGGGRSQSPLERLPAAWRLAGALALLLAVALASWAAEKKVLPQGLQWPRETTGRKPIIYAPRSYQLSHLHEVLNGLNSGFLASWIGEND